VQRRMRFAGPRGIPVTNGHEAEAEAKAAQLRKRPSRFGTWVLRHLGYRGEIGERAPHAETRTSHERPVCQPRETELASMNYIAPLCRSVTRRCRITCIRTESVCGCALVSALWWRGEFIRDTSTRKHQWIARTAQLGTSVPALEPE
jgi:hypothetical protein